jgi:cob(I)alamin adenosyltransferase
MPRERIYTKTGDDGTTGLLYGGRVRKDGELPTAYGSVDEAQAVLGLARAEAAGTDGTAAAELGALLVGIERDLYVLMAELATLPANRAKLTPEQTAVSAPMVTRLEGLIDELSKRFEPPTEFVVPGETRLAALLDLGRTVVRRAERHALVAAEPPSLVVPYLNRLSDLLWTMARWQEGHSVLAKVEEAR